MKVVYEKGEIERLEKCREESRDSGHGVIFEDDPDRVYSLSFTVTKPGLAEYLLISLLNNRLKDFELGIDIKTINFGEINNKDEVRRKLHNAIDRIIS